MTSEGEQLAMYESLILDVDTMEDDTGETDRCSIMSTDIKGKSTEKQTGEMTTSKKTTNADQQQHRRGSRKKREDKKKSEKKKKKKKKMGPYSVKRNSLLGEYLVEGKVGAGSAGQVLRAVGADGQLVALKLLNKPIKGDNNNGDNGCGDNDEETTLSMTRMNFMREVQSLLIVNGHNNVVSLLDYFETERFFVMVFPIATTDLLEVLLAKGECFTEQEAKEIMRSMANGLAHCHNLGIIHRDVKLENMLVTVTEDGKKHYELADFGLSVNITGIVDMHRKMHGDNKLLRKTVGTGSYIAPEVLQSHSKYEGSKADVYSLGICLFACLCGYLPFELACPQRCQDFQTHLRNGGVHEFPEHLSSEVKGLLKGMLDAKPEDRFSLDEVIGHGWMEGGDTGVMESGMKMLQSEGSVDLAEDEGVVQ